MADTILKPKLHAMGIAEIVGIGVAKLMVEKTTAPYIGNGNITSGLVKGVLGGVSHKYLGESTLGRIVSGAFLVDAGEDVALGLMNMTGVGAARQSSGVDW